MTYNPDIHHRRSIRLRDYDYRSDGAYFVTLCTFQRECLFGEVVGEEMQLNEVGRIVQTAWFDLPNHYTKVMLDQSIIMPNHFHGVIILTDANNVGAGLVRTGLKPAPTTPEHYGNRQGLSEIVRAFKTFSARRINQLRENAGYPVWQRNYYERIIRNETDLANIRCYIAGNPMKWDMDENNPARVQQS